MRIYCVTMCTLAMNVLASAQFNVGGDPRVHPEDFRITVFASGLNFPIGMALLPDSSLLVAVTNGDSFFESTSGSLVRLVDNDGDGVSDEQLWFATNVPGGALTSVRRSGNLVFTTGQKRPITIYRLGSSLSDTLTEVGMIEIGYSGYWLHPHSGLALRPSAGSANTCDLFFQLGSDSNFARTSRTLELTSTIGVSGIIHGDALYMVRITDNDTSVSGSDLTQIATGLRNASGIAFHPVTGDLYFNDNGIDGLIDPNEPLSADELNVIHAAEIGGAIEDFGYPDSYIEYRSGTFVGGQGIPPLVSFRPIPDPLTGSESEGPNDFAFSPPAFPQGLTNGIFVGFHGRGALGGIDNEENPLVFLDLDSLSYFHFVGNDEPDVGHLDGLQTTENSLFVADMSPGGGFGSGSANTGMVYSIRSLTNPNSVRDHMPSTPGEFRLANAYPNPFNGISTFGFHLPAGQAGITDYGLVMLRVFDLLGREVATIVNERLGPGTYTRQWDAKGLASGVYLYRISTETIVEVKKLVILK